MINSVTVVEAVYMLVYMFLRNIETKCRNLFVGKSTNALLIGENL